MGHATILTYRETCSRVFPLILCVGREPNTDEQVEPGLGRYDFDRSPSCGFWNTAYGMVARVVGKQLRTSRLKDLCRSHDASPIICADALPIGLRYRAQQKREAREAVRDEEVDRHIQNIFSEVAIIRRVRLVVLSGLEGLCFRRAVSIIRAACDRERIQHVSVPFFVGSNAGDIQEALIEDHRVIIRAVFNDFLGR
jgi:hypothetical protein